MALSSTTTRVSFNGDGSTSSFPVTFKFLDNLHVEAIHRDASGNETTWDEGTQYTLTGAGEDSGGTLTVATSPTDYRPAVGERIVIRRKPPLTQSSSLPLGGAFPSTTVEEALDLSAMRDQRLEEEIGRALSYPATDSSSLSGEIPSSVDRAGKVLAFDANGNPTVQGGTGLSVSDYSGAVADGAIADDDLLLRDKVATGVVRASTAAELAAYVRSYNHGREGLTADRTYYVRTDGSDSNTGLANTAAGAFLTLQKAADTIWDTLDLNGHTVTVSVGAGTYTAGVSVCGPATGDTGVSNGVYFLGDTTTPSNVVVSATSADCFFAQRGAQLNVGGFKCTTATSGFGLHAQSGGKIVIAAKMDFGSVPAAYAHLYADYDGWVHTGSANYTISGGGDWHMLAEDNGNILQFAGSATVTISGGPTFGVAFAGTHNEGYIRSSGYTFSGACTGPRYEAPGGAIYADGTANYFPGTVAGTATLPGAYYNIPGTSLVSTLTASVQVNTPTLSSNAASQLDLKTSGGVQVRIAHTASAVNFPVISGAAAAGRAYIYIEGTDTDPGLDISSKGAGSIILYAGQLSRKMLELVDGGVNNRHIRITSGNTGTNPKIAPVAGNMILGGGAALATNATDGLIMIPSCAGTPTGAPTDAGAGKIPFIYDTTANKLWAYNGSWRSVAVA